MLLCTKKKGMPKKYGPDGTAPLAKRSYSPRVPTSSRAPSEHNQNKTPASEPIGRNWSSVITQCNSFMPHMISPDEDVAWKIAEAAQQRRRGIVIMSANGMLKKVAVIDPAHDAGVVRQEGQFKIIQMSGTFMIHEKEGTRRGAMTVHLADSDGLHRELHRRTASKAEKPDQEPNVEESRAEPNVKTPEPEPNVETPRPEPNVETLGLEPNIGTPRPEPNVGPNVEMPRPEPNAGVVTSVVTNFFILQIQTSVIPYPPPPPPQGEDSGHFRPSKEELERYEVKNDSKEEEPKVEDYYCDYSSDYEEGKSQSSSSS
ncbi:unnamed protein product [Malus baccata var. baccata]